MIILWVSYQRGFPGGSDHLPCRRLEFDPCVENIPWRREWLPALVLLPGEFHGQKSLAVQSMGSQRVGHD